MFDIPESDIVGVRVDEEAVRTNKSPEYIRSRSHLTSDEMNDDINPEDELKTKRDGDSKISVPTC